MKKYLFKTVRLGLRPLETNDLDEVAKLNADPEVRKFFSDGVQTREQTAIRLQELLSFHHDYGLPSFALFELASGKFVGRAGFGLIESGEIEVGYLLHHAFWNQGYASEALTALLQWAKQHIKAEYIIAFAPTAHFASQRVMQKGGMEYYKEGITKNVLCRFYRIANTASAAL